MINNFRNQSVGFQLRLIIALCLLLAFASIATLVYRNAAQLLLDNTLREHQTRVESMAKAISGQFDAYLHTAKVLESTFRNGYLADAASDGSQIQFQGHTIADIRLAGESLIGSSDSRTRFL